ncbi:MAG TPA: hypothetical protein VGK98_13200 [Arthrobacter sp.]|uniref:hypothetical protein n=1 Tax=Arthrobacter sp. TaxID=1667 RepID=UPI002F404A15
MNEEEGLHSDENLLRTGVNDHAWEREHRHPTAAQASAIGNRRRDAEAKLARHQQQASHRATE